MHLPPSLTSSEAGLRQTVNNRFTENLKLSLQMDNLHRRGSLAISSDHELLLELDWNFVCAHMWTYVCVQVCAEARD